MSGATGPFEQRDYGDENPEPLQGLLDAQHYLGYDQEPLVQVCAHCGVNAVREGSGYCGDICEVTHRHESD